MPQTRFDGILIFALFNFFCRRNPLQSVLKCCIAIYRKVDKFIAMDNSPCESECSLDGGLSSSMLPPSPISREQLQKRIESLNQQNKVLKVELDTYKIRVKVLQEENKSLRQASVNIVSVINY